MKNVLNISWNNKNGPESGKLVFHFHHFNRLVQVFCDDIIPVAQADRIHENKRGMVNKNKSVTNFYRKKISTLLIGSSLYR